MPNDYRITTHPALLARAAWWHGATAPRQRLTHQPKSFATCYFGRCRPSGGCFGGGRKAERESGKSAGRAFDTDSATMEFHDRLHDREAESDALSCFFAR